MPARHSLRIVRTREILAGVCLVLWVLGSPSVGRAAYLYYSTAGSPDSTIKRANLDGSGVQTILSNPVSGRFGGIAFDDAKGHLYSGDGSWVFRTNLDGSGRTNLVASSAPVSDVELDLVNNKVYWGIFTATPTRVYRANLDGSNVEQVLERPLGNFEGLAIDPAAGKLYAAADSFEVRVANLDGSTESVFRTSTASPFDLEIDTSSGFLYWNHSGGPNMVRAKLDGSGGIELVHANPSRIDNGLHLDPVGGRLYFSDRSVDTIGGPVDLNRINTDGTGRQLVLSDLGRINYMEVSQVPEPSSVVLLALGAVGVVGWCAQRRVRRR